MTLLYYVDACADDQELLGSYLDLDAVRDALKITRVDPSTGDYKWGSTSVGVEEALFADLNAPTAVPQIEALLSDGVPVMIYTGQFDLICNTVGVEQYIQKLDWTSKEQFQSVSRSVWKLGTGRTAGWRRSGGGLTQVIVQGCGHMCPSDQPEAMMDLVQWFLKTATDDSENVRQTTLRQFTAEQ